MKNDFRRMLEAIEAIVNRYYPVIEEGFNPGAGEMPKARAAAAGGQ